MLRIDGASAIVSALDAIRLPKIRLNSEGINGSEYYALITDSGFAFVPFASGSIEIYDKTEWRKA